MSLCPAFVSGIWSIGTMVRTGRGGRGFGRGGRGGFMHKPRAPFIPHVPFDHVMAEPAFPPVKPQNNDHIQEVKHNSCFSGMSTYVADLTSAKLSAKLKQIPWIVPTTYRRTHI